jgi:hypothetical protein
MTGAQGEGGASVSLKDFQVLGGYSRTGQFSVGWW